MLSGCCIGLCVVALFNVPGGILDWGKLRGIKQSWWAFFLLVSFLQLGPGNENDLHIFSYCIGLYVRGDNKGGTSWALCNSCREHQEARCSLERCLSYILCSGLRGSCLGILF